MRAFQITSATGDQSIEIAGDRPVIIGRAVTSDLPVYDPTVSRKHAELVLGRDGVHLADLGSSNGTFVNGARIREAVLRDGDVVTFGKVAFNVREVARQPAPPAAEPFARAPEATIVRPIPVDETPSLEQHVVAAAGSTHLKLAGESPEERQATRFRLLLEILSELGKQLDIDKLLEKAVDITFTVMNVDRVSILLTDQKTGALIPRTARTKFGDSADGRHVPSSIANRCVQERVAIVTDNAAADERFTGQSILMQSVRSAMSAPLIGSEGRVLGILYVDNLTATNSFGDEDLDFLIAFSGIMAIAIENSQLSIRLARAAVVRSNFERYFAPGLVEQIAGQEHEVQPGGAKRPVVIFFSDIRDFTPLAAEMRPDDMAALLTEYFTEMVEIIFEHGGTLDKFMGDAIMAIWGAPIAQDDDADRAMRAALEMTEALAALNRKWIADARPPIRVGIGINYGEVFAGNIGSHKRLEYTVIGDPVNVAYRLCSNAAGGEILVSEPFYQVLRSPPPAEPLDLRIKGKKTEVPAYRVKQ